VGKYRTWVATGLAAAAAVAGGVALDRALGTVAVFTVAAAGAAAVYLIGTFKPTARVFGRVPGAARADAAPDTFALTFDDGPDPAATPAISRQLAERGHRATFFVLGRHARQHPDVLRQLVADGHELANHGDDHRLLAFAPPKAVHAQLAGTEHAVRAAVGASPARLFRPPHGVRSPWLVAAVRRRGYTTCAWRGSVFDSARPGADVITARVRALLEPGSIVLLHDGDGSGRGDSRQQTADAVPAILDEAERRGLRSVPLSSLLE
jgi:peptidoglycan/xylan/chitin deacetylase (PgdA/CDA1 family)